MGGLSTVLWGSIDSRRKGWTSPATLSVFLVGVILIGFFIRWERRYESPMLNIEFFKNPRFSIASGAIIVTFFAMFGSIFVLTQYLQFVLGYTPLDTGLRLLAFALPLMIVSPLRAHFT